MMPIGPAPVISTSSPSTSNESAVCTALPNGSKIAATSRSIAVGVMPDVGHRQGDVLGERARAVHADALGVLAEVPAAGQAVAAAAADHVPLAADDVARDGSRSTFEPTSTISPTNSWPTTIGTGIVFACPGVPVVDVQVGAADAGAVHADQHVVDADLGLGDVLQPQPRLRARFDERLHGGCTIAPGPEGRASAPFKRRGRPFQISAFWEWSGSAKLAPLNHSGRGGTP